MVHLTAPCQFSFIIYCFQSGALFLVLIQHRIVQGRRRLQGLQVKPPVWSKSSWSRLPPVEFLMFILLIIHFKYSFDAAKCERKHLKIRLGCKTRELAANLSRTSNPYQLELYKITKQLSRLPATLAPLAWTNFTNFCSQGRFPRTKGYIESFFQCRVKHSFFFSNQINFWQEYFFSCFKRAQKIRFNSWI